MLVIQGFIKVGPKFIEEVIEHDEIFKHRKSTLKQAEIRIAEFKAFF